LARNRSCISTAIFMIGVLINSSSTWLKNYWEYLLPQIFRLIADNFMRGYEWPFTIAQGRNLSLNFINQLLNRCLRLRITYILDTTLVSCCCLPKKQRWAHHFWWLFAFLWIELIIFRRLSSLAYYIQGCSKYYNLSQGNNAISKENILNILSKLINLALY
jgi:hypothetical protein